MQAAEAAVEMVNLLGMITPGGSMTSVPAGFTGGRLGFRNTWNKTEVTDPTTGEKRPISGVRPTQANVGLEQDITRLKMLQLSVEDRLGDVVARADTTLMVSHTLRGKLSEAHDLIFDDLEGGDVAQWVHRVKRLSELGLEEEASELEQSLIELTRNDPELQTEFLKSLTRDAGRLVADPGVN